MSLKNYGGVMTTKYPSYSKLEEEQLSKADKFQIINLDPYSKEQDDRDVNAKKNNPQSNSYNYYVGESIGLIIIENYFQEHPNKRKALAKHVAKHITSIDTVLKVLDWGTSRKIREGFDATVMLLAECGNVIISTLNHLQKTSTDDKDLFVLEKKWEILITSIACASNIPAQKRFNAIVKLIPDSNRRSVKTAIIDALVIMEDEIDAESIKSQLEHFLSDSEHDEYVKEYAKEALEDM